MRFVYTDKKCEMHFSDDEINLLIEKQTLVFEYENIRHLQNNLSRIVAELFVSIKKDHPEFKNLQSRDKQDINCV
tara:strand:- start:288 stop:512 length:225 start_codon:yes stop_codon:yes gene_type:complete